MAAKYHFSMGNPMYKKFLDKNILKPVIFVKRLRIYFMINLKVFFNIIRVRVGVRVRVRVRVKE